MWCEGWSWQGKDFLSSGYFTLRPMRATFLQPSPAPFHRALPSPPSSSTGQPPTDSRVSGREGWERTGGRGADGLRTEVGKREGEGREEGACPCPASSGETVAVWGEAVRPHVWMSDFCITSCKLRVYSHLHPISWAGEGPCCVPRSQQSSGSVNGGQKKE